MLSYSSLAIAAISTNFDVDSTKKSTQKLTKSVIVDTRNDRPKDLKMNYRPFNPATFNYKVDQDNNKTISNVKVFPSPISDQINIAFKLNKDIKVTIKIMDALGNEITTLLSQRLSMGEQSHGFMVNGKLNSGYYFIRVMAGTETVVKRIQVL